MGWISWENDVYVCRHGTVSREMRISLSEKRRREKFVLRSVQDTERQKDIDWSFSPHRLSSHFDRQLRLRTHHHQTITIIRIIASHHNSEQPFYPVYIMKKIMASELDKLKKGEYRILTSGTQSFLSLCDTQSPILFNYNSSTFDIFIFNWDRTSVD